MKPKTAIDNHQHHNPILNSPYEESQLHYRTNDEAHHCYLPHSKKKTQDTEGDENAKAAIWFTGLSELSKKFKLSAVYDLSATPYYLKGSISQFGEESTKVLEMK